MTFLKKNKVVLGLSGGVDSTTAALLLQEKGYEVTGLYFDVKEGQEEGLARAQRAASQLGIELIYRNLSQRFEETVIDNFCREYSMGRTPNPCIVCNPAVKFNTLRQAADEAGAYYIATGHYADTYYHEDDKLWYIKRASSREKDQSYMLYRLAQDVISRLLLPLNTMEDKESVRNIAREKELANAEAKDSQEICFIDETSDYKEFLKKRGLSLSKGNFVDAQGNILGQHSGILNYTIGQRKGLGITFGKPVFVTAIDGETGNITLGENRDLFTQNVLSTDNVFAGRIQRGEVLTAKIRYGAKPCPGEIASVNDDRTVFRFKEPQRAATPGQSIVFYRDDLVVGGGFIKSSY